MAKTKEGLGSEQQQDQIAPPSCTSGLTAAAPSRRMGCGYRGKGWEMGEALTEVYAWPRGKMK